MHALCDSDGMLETKSAILWLVCLGVPFLMLGKNLAWHRIITSVVEQCMW